MIQNSFLEMTMSKKIDLNKKKETNYCPKLETYLKKEILNISDVHGESMNPIPKDTTIHMYNHFTIDKLPDKYIIRVLIEFQDSLSKKWLSSTYYFAMKNLVYNETKRFNSISAEEKRIFVNY